MDRRNLPRSRFTTKRRNLKPYFLLALLAVGGAFGVASAVHRRQGVVTTSSPVAAALAQRVSAVIPSCASQLSSTHKVGIQIGHLNTDQLPDELANLHWDFGTSADGVNEVDVNQDVAGRVATLLKNQGINVDLLPATVPEDYCANAFVAIHVDGNDDTSVYGYKVASSSWDTDGKAESLSDNIIQDYGQLTQMEQNPTITKDMTEYYAFNYQKFTHTIDPATPGAIIELGFVSNDIDRNQLVNNPQILAQGVARGIIDYLNGKVAPTPAPAEIIDNAD